MKFRALGAILAAASFTGLNMRGGAQSYTFTTLVGSVTGTNDGINSAAQFYFPSGIAVDGAGNLFVADTSNNTIRKVSPVGDNWKVTTIAGTPALGAPGGTNDGVNGEAQFWRPNGVTVDTNGNVFVVDHYNHSIRKITLKGTDWNVSTIAGLPGTRGYADGTNSDARFWNPTGITLDSQGNLYVADTFTYTIRKIVPDGTNWVVSTIAGSPLTFGFVDDSNQNAEFDLPFGITVDRSNNVYVADYGNNAIRKIQPVGPNWIVTTIAGTGSVGSGNGTNTAAQFNSPADVTADKAGNLYVSDQYNHTIRKITPEGTNWVTSTVGGVPLQSGKTNGPGSNARFNKPWGISVDANGVLFIVDYANQLIRAGVPASSAPPTLRLQASGTNVSLTWPLSASGFQLETSGNLGSGASWTPLSNGVAISGNNFLLITNTSLGRVFYRLRGH